MSNPQEASPSRLMSDRDILIRLESAMAHLTLAITGLTESQHSSKAAQSSELAAVRRDLMAKIDNVDRSTSQHAATTDTLLATLSGFVNRMDTLLEQERKERKEQLNRQRELIQQILEGASTREDRATTRATEVADREVKAAQSREEEAQQMLKETAKVLWDSVGKYIVWAAGLLGAGGAIAYGFLNAPGG